ncbi:MAG TPA: phosphoribosyltransferase family protein, partial [Candidatus Limnocylindria bacterium]|nr:phosphoribosyltransferase family protein [Candidatus Limnocylindria bacterium]
SVVLGVPRGGVVIAAVVCRRLGFRLDVIVARKIGAPGNPELAVGAVASDGTTIVEPWAAEMGLTDAYLRAEAERQIAAARQREQALRAERQPADIAERTVVLVDDGVATGASMHAAIQVARARRAASIVVAVPVIVPQTAEWLAGMADEVVAAAAPTWLGAVGMAYRRFEQVGDTEVARLLSAGRE